MEAERLRGEEVMNIQREEGESKNNEISPAEPRRRAFDSFSGASLLLLDSARLSESQQSETLQSPSPGIYTASSSGRATSLWRNALDGL